MFSRVQKLENFLPWCRLALFISKYHTELCQNISQLRDWNEMFRFDFYCKKLICIQISFFIHLQSLHFLYSFIGDFSWNLQLVKVFNFLSTIPSLGRTSRFCQKLAHVVNFAFSVLQICLNQIPGELALTALSRTCFSSPSNPFTFNTNICFEIVLY